MTRRRKHDEFTEKEKTRIGELHTKHGVTFTALAVRFATSAENISRYVTEYVDAQRKASPAQE